MTINLIKIFVIIIFSLSLIFFTSCKSSFPKEELPKLAQEKIKKEANYDTQVFLKGATMYIIADFPDTIPLNLTISREAYDIIQDILLATTNIALSTDAKIEYFVVVIIDTATKIQLTFKQNIIDIKKWFYGLIGREDFFQRSLTEIKYFDSNTPNNDYVEITTPNFIMDQTLYILKGNIRYEISELDKKLLEEDKIRKISIKNNAQISPQNIENIRNFISQIQKNKVLEIYITSIMSKDYRQTEIFDSKNKKITKNIFEYNFSRFENSANNFLQIDYEEFGKKLVETNLEVCKKYDFTNFDEIIMTENRNIIYSYIKPQKI